MEALTELTEAQAATACTILVSLFTLYFNPFAMQAAWRLCQSKQRPKLPPPVQFLSRFLPYFNPLRSRQHGSMEALPEQTEVQAATPCTIPISFFTLF